MRVLVFEVNPSGHRLQYAGIVIQSVAELADEIILVTSQSATDSVAFQEFIQPHNARIQVDSTTPDVSGSSLAQAIQTVRSFRKAVKKYSPDQVYVPTADGFAQIFGLAEAFGFRALRKEAELEVLLMGGHRYFRNDNWKTRVARRLWTRSIRLARPRIVHILDPWLRAKIEASVESTALCDRLRDIPEPVEPLSNTNTESARKQLGLNQDGRYIGFFGRACLRKGADTLLRSFAQSSLQPNDRLLLMGKTDSSIREQLNQQYNDLVTSGKIVVFDRFVSQQELELGLSSVDVVCIPYPRHSGSSGFVVRSAAMNKFILATDFGWIGDMVQKFQLGLTCDATNTTKLSSAIAESLDQSEGFSLDDRSKSFIQYHTLTNACAHWTRRLRARMNLDEPSDLCEWATVS